MKVTFGSINTSSLYSKTVPKLNAALDLDPIPDNDVIFNQNVGADIAVSADLVLERMTTYCQILVPAPMVCAATSASLWMVAPFSFCSFITHYRRFS